MGWGDGEITNKILVLKFLFGKEYRKGFRQDLGKGLARVWTGPGQDADRVSSMGLGKVLGRAPARVQTEFGQGFG